MTMAAVTLLLVIERYVALDNGSRFARRRYNLEFGTQYGAFCMGDGIHAAVRGVCMARKIARRGPARASMREKVCRFDEFRNG